MPRAIQTFEVSLKAAIFREDRLLLVQEADTGFWELPGGRIDVGEERLAHADILAREVAEELGAAFKIRPRAELVTWVRQRPTEGMFQFIAARLADDVSGKAVLSAEHQGMRWTMPPDWDAMEFPDLSDYRAALGRVWKLRDGIRGAQRSIV